MKSTWVKVRSASKIARILARNWVAFFLAKAFAGLPRSIKTRLGFEFFEVFGTRELSSNLKQSRNLVGASKYARIVIHPNLDNQTVVRRRLRRRRLIFVYGGLSPSSWGPNVTQLLKSAKWNLIIGGSDRSFPRQKDLRYPPHRGDELRAIERVSTHRQIEQIWVENLDELGKGYRAIPTGLVPDKYNSPLVRKVRYQDFPKPAKAKTALCAQRTRPGKQFSDRRELEKLALGPWSEFTTLVAEPVSLRGFQHMVRNHRFTLCAHGGGFDPSPKAFEALLAGSIPIIKRSPVISAYEELPIVIVDEWTETALNEEKLLAEYERIESANDYWERVTSILSMRHWIKAMSRSPQ